MINASKMICIRGILWESIHDEMVVRSGTDAFIRNMMKEYIDNRSDLDDEERKYLYRVSCSMIKEQRAKKINHDEVNKNENLT